MKTAEEILEWINRYGNVIHTLKIAIEKSEDKSRVAIFNFSLLILNELKNFIEEKEG